jgi:hypothetical protein
MAMNRLIIFLLLAATVFSSCNMIAGKRIRGSSVMKSEYRDVSSFSRIDVSGSIDVYVRQDSAYSVRIETDDNLLEYIEVSVENGTLSIEPRNHTRLKPSKDIKVYVNGPVITGLSASGACDIRGENKISNNSSLKIDLTGATSINLDLSSPEVKVYASGASEVDLKGETRDLSLNGTGSSDFDCINLLSEKTVIKLSGAGNAKVFASVELDVDVSGAADVQYRGNAKVSQSISGAGSVKQIDKR